MASDPICVGSPIELPAGAVPVPVGIPVNSVATAATPLITPVMSANVDSWL
jgi:hypothetical protein